MQVGLLGVRSACKVQTISSSLAAKRPGVSPPAAAGMECDKKEKRSPPRSLASHCIFSALSLSPPHLTYLLASCNHDSISILLLLVSLAVSIDIADWILEAGPLSLPAPSTWSCLLSSYQIFCFLPNLPPSIISEQPRLADCITATIQSVF